MRLGFGWGLVAGVALGYVVLPRVAGMLGSSSTKKKGG